MSARSRPSRAQTPNSARDGAREVAIRRGGLRDLPLLIRHRLAMERELNRGRIEGLSTFERAYRNWMAERIEAGRLIPFMAIDPEGRAVGSGSIWLREDRPHRRDSNLLLPRVHGIYVEPRARRAGVATGLLREMLRWVRRKGFRRVTLRTTSRAEALYLRHGFRRNSEMERDW